MDVDLNMAYLTDCKYYSVDEFQKLKINNNFNLFHSNTNSLQAKFDNLHQFIASLPSTGLVQTQNYFFLTFS